MLSETLGGFDSVGGAQAHLSPSQGPSPWIGHGQAVFDHSTAIGKNDSSPRDPKQGEKGKIDKFNKIRSIFGFFAKMELGASR